MTLCHWMTLALLMPRGVSDACAQQPDGNDALRRFPITRLDGDLIVTGEKADRSLQDTPTSVTIMTSRSIVNENMISAYDVLDRTPNVVTDGNRTTFSIRGVDAFNVSGGGDAALASLYVDGASLPRLALAAGPLDLYDVAQVEVFRGPQSTIQGRNALAGAVIINTVDPSFDWDGKARLLMSNRDGQKRANVAIGGPLTEDQIAFRLTGGRSETDGLIRNVTVDGDADQQRSETLRGKILFTPQLVPDLRMLGAFTYDRHRRGTFYTELDAPYDPRERISTADIRDIKQGTSYTGSLTIGYDFCCGLALSSISNFSHIRFRSLSDADRSAAPDGVSRIDDLTKTFQQEVRLNIQKGWINGLMGGFYLREKRNYNFAATQSLGLTSLGVDRQLQAIGLPSATIDSVLKLYGGVVPIRNALFQPRLTENYAGFADFNFPLSSRLQLQLGLRYDRETQERGARQVVAIDRALPDPATLPNPTLAQIVTRLNAVLAGIAERANSVEPIRQVSYQSWLPKWGITYDAAKDIILSLTAQRGYRAGGSGYNEQRGQAYSFRPEHIWNYEFALRSAWLDNRLHLNANAYWTDWTDQQISVQLTPGSLFDTQVINAGKSRLYGTEIEARSQVTKALNLYAGIGYSNTRFRDFTANVGTLVQNAQGNEFLRAPHWTFSGGATISSPGGLSANVNANYRSAYYQNIIDQRFHDIPGRTLVNARLGWQGRHVGAYLTATNIFNVQKPVQFFTDIDGRRRGTLNDPRILGFTLEGQI